MDDINTEFDNLTGLSAVKDFDQGQDEAVSVFDVPQIYQEFDHVENEIDKTEQTFNEVKAYSDKLTSAQVIRRDDVLALESIISDLSALPHVNSYTAEYSIVNYKITQESVFSKLKKVTGDILKAVWEFILKGLEYVFNHLKNLFNPKKYKNNPKDRERVIVEQNKAKEAAQRASDAVKKRRSDDTTKANTTSTTSGPVSTPLDANNPTTDNTLSDKEKERIVKLNRDLRSLLYPAFGELAVLSQGGDINPELLIDEMCEQRFAMFYTTFFKAMYEKDHVVADFLRLYTRVMNNDVGVLSGRTEGFLSNDLTKPLSEKYISHYNEAPEQLKEFVKKYGGNNVPAGEVKDPSKEFRAYVILAHTVSSNMVSIRDTHTLPEPRALLNMDLGWLSILDGVTDKTLKSIDENYKNLKKIKSKSNVRYPDIDPSNKASVTLLYNDWLVLNRAMMTTSLYLARINAITNNYLTLMKYINRTSDLFA